MATTTVTGTGGLSTKANGSEPGVHYAQNVTEMNEVVCYTPSMMLSNGVWSGESPMAFTIPVFVVQLTIIIVTSRILVFVLRPLRQPRVVSEILTGLILGPSVIGRYTNFGELFFPLRSVSVLETMANLGLLYFLFLVGVEMDLSMIKRTGKKALAVALGGMFLPFLVGTFAAFYYFNNQVHPGTFLLFVGVCLSVTAFPVLARILAELKLLNTDLGRVAISAAVINDLLSWILLALAIALSESRGSALIALWVVLSGTTFIFFCLYAVRPTVTWMIKRTPEGEPMSDINLSFILAGVMLSGVLTDAIGIHAIFGAFVYGLVIPNGQLGATLIDKLEDFVSGLLLPIFFAISGLRANIASIQDVGACVVLITIILLACAGKVAGTLFICRIYGMPYREGLSLGMLMNTKGLVEMIVLNVGREQKVINEGTFVVLVIMSVVVTMAVTPAVTSIYRPMRRFAPYKRRTIQRTRLDQELRVLVGIHNPRSIPTMINLLEATHPTKHSPLSIFALHLVELTGRATAMMIAHNYSKSSSAAHFKHHTHSRAPVNRTQAYSDQIANALDNYQQQSLGVSASTHTAISPYSSMHEDICNLAEDKRVALILLPFHKEQTLDGAMESANPAFRSINSSVLANAPCSVAILVDRGLATAARAPSSMAHHVIVLFFGGPDDREALACAWHMAEHPAVRLTVVRFVEDGGSAAAPSGMLHLDAADKSDSKMLTMTTEEERERQLDEDYLNQFRLQHASNEAVVYAEKVVGNGEDMVEAIRRLDSVYDLFIVGRGQGSSPLTAGLTDWSECPELGAVGDLLASSDFAATATVLVVQQYVGVMPADGVATPDSPGIQIEQYLDNIRRPRGGPHAYR